MQLKRKLEVSEKALARSKKSRSSPVCSKRDQSLVQFGFVVTRQEDAERVDVTQEYACYLFRWSVESAAACFLRSKLWAATWPCTSV